MILVLLPPLHPLWVRCSFPQESIGINQSLFVLRNVIKALASGLREDEGASHFRDSKLTSLLKVWEGR